MTHFESVPENGSMCPEVHYKQLPRSSNVIAMARFDATSHASRL